MQQNHHHYAVNNYQESSFSNIEHYANVIFQKYQKVPALEKGL